MRNQLSNGTAPVLGLFFHGGPTAVGLGVGAVIVDTFNRVAWRRLEPHIVHERLRGSAPLVAHDDASSTVPFVGWVSWKMAASQRMQPRLVLSGASEPVFEATKPNGLVLQASTTFHVTVPQVGQQGLALIPAVASAHPPVRAFDASEDSHSVEALPNRGVVAHSHDDHYRSFGGA